MKVRFIKSPYYLTAVLHLRTSLPANDKTEVVPLPDNKVETVSEAVEKLQDKFHRYDSMDVTVSKSYLKNEPGELQPPVEEES